MAEDWAANVKKYVPDADDGIISGIVRYCGIALQKPDSSLVSMSDFKETGRVRENFLKKKLALTQPDAELDTAIMAVGTRMKAENFKNRVTVYYLLADSFGKLGLFAKAGSATVSADQATPANDPASGLGAAARGAAGSGASPDTPELISATPIAPPAPVAVVPPPPPPASMSPPSEPAAPQPLLDPAALATDDGTGTRWLPWLLIAVGLILLLVLLSRCS